MPQPPSHPTTFDDVIHNLLRPRPKPPEIRHCPPNGWATVSELLDKYERRP